MYKNSRESVVEGSGRSAYSSGGGRYSTAHVTWVVSLLHINASCQIQSTALDLARQATVLPRVHVPVHVGWGGVVSKALRMLAGISVGAAVRGTDGV